MNKKTPKRWEANINKNIINSATTEIGAQLDKALGGTIGAGILLPVIKRYSKSTSSKALPLSVTLGALLGYGAGGYLTHKLTKKTKNKDKGKKKNKDK